MGDEVAVVGAEDQQALEAFMLVAEGAGIDEALNILSQSGPH